MTFVFCEKLLCRYFLLAKDVLLFTLESYSTDNKMNPTPLYPRVQGSRACSFQQSSSRCTINLLL